VHNNWRNETTGLSPNQILLGYELMLQPEEETPSNNEAIEMRVQNMKEKRVQAINAINRVAQMKQVMTSQYKLGEQVWLETTHLKICHQRMKLKPK
jgi:di/tripeptidase